MMPEKIWPTKPMVDEPKTTTKCDIVATATDSGGSHYYCITHGCVMRIRVNGPIPLVCHCANSREGSQTMSNTMPERIYVDNDYCDGDNQTWYYVGAEADYCYIRIDVHEAAVAAEREAILELVNSYTKDQIELYRDAKTNPDTIRDMRFYDGSSDAGERIADAIRARDTGNSDMVDSDKE